MLEGLTTGQTAVLAAGVYTLAADAYISMRTDGVTVRGATGDASDVIIDGGEVACSHLELTDAGRPHVRNNCYTGGIDAHQARGWHIRDNRIEGFWCESGLSEHGVHFWRGGRDTLIERNTLVNNARGIGLGLGQDDVGRRYSDSPRGGSIAQSYSETAVNNMVFADDAALFASSSGFDSGISLESACDLHLAEGCAAIDTASPSASIARDFDGDARDATPDVGADEHLADGPRATRRL